MTGTEWNKVLLSAADRMAAAKDELTAIDSRFGDGDHGVTIEKIAAEMRLSAAAYREGQDIKAQLDALGMAIMGVNGGSAGPLWGTLIGGLALGLDDGCSEINEDDLKNMFVAGLSELQDITSAKVGDKTMMDTLIPAVQAMQDAEGNASQILEAACRAAVDGAKASEGFISKFGRAKSYKEQTIGTPDAGAVSMKYFFIGLSEGVK